MHHAFCLLILCSATEALAQAAPPDSVPIVGSVHAGAFGRLGPHLLNRETGPLRDTLFITRVIRGTAFPYRFFSRPGWDPPVVVLDLSLRAATDSTLVLTGPIMFEVAAHRTPRLTPLNRPLYEQLRALFRSPDPVPVYQQVMCETFKLFEAVSTDSASLLGRWADELARAELADPQAERRVDGLLAGHVFDSGCPNQPVH
jgi:hypothetical protein